jgi:hypothetical protein
MKPPPKLAAATIAHAVPAGQPQSVRDLAAALYGAYTVEGGRVHLGGCRLEDRPLVRLAPPDAAAGAAPRYAWPDGTQPDAALRQALGVEKLVELAGPPAGHTPAEAEALVESARAAVGARPTNGGPAAGEATLVWCKFAEGRIEFVIGERTADVPFAGWARLLAEGSARPPPFVCPASGVESYRGAATDDGRVTAAEAIEACRVSGRRVLAKELETCPATGTRALGEYLVACPVSADRVLKSALVECSSCRQAVAPKAIASGQCAACRELRRVSKDDPRMARVLGELPGLDRWGSWRIAETKRAYVLVATSFVRRLLAVIDKNTLEPLHLATAGRWFSSWSEVPPEQRGELLR